MSDTMEIKAAHSRESELDRQIDDLIRKLVASGSSGLGEQDSANLSNLMAQRSRLMRPPMPEFRAGRHFGRLATSK